MKLLLRMSFGHWIINSTAALLATALLSSPAMADNIWYVAPGGAGSGTSVGSPFGTIEQAYQAAYVSSGAQTIDLASGTYGPNDIGTYMGANGVLNLESGGSAPTASSITIQGSAPGAVTLNDTGATGGDVDSPRTHASMLEGFNSYTPGTLTFQNINFNTSGVSNFIDQNTQGLPMTFTNDKITLGYSGAGTGYFYAETGEIPGNEWTFNNSSIYLGRTGVDPTGFNVLGLGYKDFPGPSNDLFNGEGTSTIYDANGNPVSDLSTLYIEDRAGTGASGGVAYPDYYQNGVSYWSTGEGNFAQNFVAPAPVPEPSSMLLLSLGAVGLFVTARRRRNVA